MIELALEPTTWLILCSAALGAGFIDAVAGGGGMLTVPALLTAGLPPHLALGTNKLAASFGSITASVTYYRKKLFNPRFWLTSAIATALGAILGTVLVDFLSTDFLTILIPIVIIIVALYSLFSRNQFADNAPLPKQSTQLTVKQSVQGVMLGFYDGVAGPGAGTFWTASNAFLYRMGILLNCGVARSMNFISNVVSLATFFVLGHVHLLLGLTMGLFIMLGAWIGAHSAIKFGSKFIKPVFNSVVIILAIKLIFDAYA